MVNLRQVVKVTMDNLITPITMDHQTNTTTVPQTNTSHIINHMAPLHNRTTAIMDGKQDTEVHTTLKVNNITSTANMANKDSTANTANKVNTVNKDHMAVTDKPHTTNTANKASTASNNTALHPTTNSTAQDQTITAAAAMVGSNPTAALLPNPIPAMVTADPLSLDGRRDTNIQA